MATLAVTHARIGETMEQATERYGEPVSSGVEDNDEWTFFKKGGFVVYVIFYEGKIEHIEYIKQKPGAGTDKLTSTELSDTEINNFLKANYSGKWNSSLLQ